MSYVLDALRKADAERERGAVPGLNAQPAPLIAAGEDPPRARPPWVWIAAMVVVLAAAAAWLLWPAGRPATPPPGPVAQAPTATPVPAPTTGAAVTAPAALPAPAIAAAVPASASGLPPPSPAAPWPTPSPTPAPHAAAPARPAPPGVPPPAPVAVAPSPMVALGALPEDVRRQLPPLRVDGSMYSGDAAARFVIIDGKLLHEGEELAPGLVVEEIRLKAAVLAFKGQRFSIRY